MKLGMTGKRLELLAPAGSTESLIAAVQNGADAVYLGGRRFNARRNAGNFDDDAMREAIAYCHVRNVKVYVTMNTLMFDRELPDAVEYAAALYSMGADAIIVQDTGFLTLVRKYVPDLELHASTQMGIHNSDGLAYCLGLGLKRAVLSRETSVSDMKRMSELNTGVELEAFGHGALCMSFSGGCLYSSMSGERSGNRGLCAQPCRKRASVNGCPSDTDYCLSPNDLMTLEHLDALKGAGVSCIKIEGRMKSPEYVALTTAAYRAAIDGRKPDKNMIKELYDMFNRGFSTGYLFGDDVRTDSRGDSAPSAELLKRIGGSINGEHIKRPVNMRITARMGEPMKLEMSCGEVTAAALGDVVQAAKKAQDMSIYDRQLRKLGDTPFEAESIEVLADEGAFAAASALNALRRSACDTLCEMLSGRREACSIDKEAILQNAQKRTQSGDTVVIARVRTKEQALAAADANADEIIFDPVVYDEASLRELSSVRSMGKRLVLALPAVMRGTENREKIRRLLTEELIDGAEANAHGQLALMKNLTYKIAGAALNCQNTASLHALYGQGFDRVLLSNELTHAQMRDILNHSTASLNVYGRVPLMNLLHCPVKEHNGCRRCGGFAGTVTDEERRRFPLVNTVLSDGCLVRMLNCVPTFIMDIACELKNADAWHLNFFDESPEEVRKLLSQAKKALKGDKIPTPEGITRGHYKRAVL